MSGLSGLSNQACDLRRRGLLVMSREIARTRPRCARPCVVLQPLAGYRLRGMDGGVTPAETDGHELRTIRDYLRFAVSRFRESGIVFGQGASNALDEAAFLILESLHLPPDDINPWLD